MSHSLVVEEFPKSHGLQRHWFETPVVLLLLLKVTLQVLPVWAEV